MFKMKVKLHSTKNENESAASCASVPVAPSAPEFHREARVAASFNSMTTKIKIAPLPIGTKVAIANCTDYGYITARIGKNLYEVCWRTHRLTLPRVHLTVAR